MVVVVDVLSLVAESTRMAVRFDDSTSAEQHQVISAHVRRRADAEEARGLADGGGWTEEKGDEDEDDDDEGKEQWRKRLGSKVSSSGAGAAGRAAAPTKRRGFDAAQSRGNGALAGQDSFRHGVEVSGGVGDVYFDDARGVVQEEFDDYFATMSGYASVDVVVGNAAELLLLLQTMLASDIQSLKDDLFHLISRVPIEALWPRYHPFDARRTSTGKSGGSAGGSAGRKRPKTYGEAYRTLLEDRDLLVMGIHRPPARRRGDPRSKRYPGGSWYVAINCPSASFVLRDGDCFFVLRRPSDVGEGGGAAPSANATSRSEAVDFRDPAYVPRVVAPFAAAAGGVGRGAGDEGTG